MLLQVPPKVALGPRQIARLHRPPAAVQQVLRGSGQQDWQSNIPASASLEQPVIPGQYTATGCCVPVRESTRVASPQK